MPSEEFDKFLRSFFDSSKEGAPDSLATWVLHQLGPEERQQAEEIMLKHLPDGRSIIGLSEMRSRQAAAPLQALLPQLSGRLRLLTAEALWTIASSADAVRHIIDVLHNDLEETNRMDAAIALREIPSLETAQALVHALHDENELVRYHAANALLVIYGLGTWKDLSATTRHSLVSQIWSAQLDIRQQAIAELYDLLQREGKPLSSLFAAS